MFGTLSCIVLILKVEQAAGDKDPDAADNGDHIGDR